MIRTFAWLAVSGLIITFSAGCANTVNEGSVSDASGVAAPAGANEPVADTPTWGKRYTWSNGLAVEIAPPVPCQPGEFSSPAAKDIVRAVKFTITVINGTNEAIRAGTLSVGSSAQFNGRTADEIFDSGGECGEGFESATVLPGKTFTTAVAYSVGPEQGEMQIGLQPALGADEAVFVGQA